MVAVHVTRKAFEICTTLCPHVLSCTNFFSFLGVDFCLVLMGIWIQLNYKAIKSKAQLFTSGLRPTGIPSSQILSFSTHRAIRVRVLVPRPIKDTLKHHILNTTNFCFSSSVLTTYVFQFPSFVSNTSKVSFFRLLIFAFCSLFQSLKDES